MNNNPFFDGLKPLKLYTPEQLRQLLRQAMAMLDECLAPPVDHEEAKAWLARRDALRDQVMDALAEE